MLWRALVLLIALVLPQFALAQGAATLVADTVYVADGQRLVAQGNVAVLYDGTRLSAAAITYDQATDRLIITGPIFITDGAGNILTADRASLDPTLENGILRGARLVLDQQLQLAANQINRVDGRYSQLHRVVATSCQVCAGETPLWDIRAGRVVHDQQERQLYFDDAQFRVAGVPIFWVPRMRLPDPTLTRATGLLIPQIRTTDQLGTGIKLPYFIRLGDHRDLTLTPYFSPRTTTLEARYRQAFVNGDIEINLAGTTDDLLPDTGRGYIFATGQFDLGSDYTLTFDLEATTDRDYLLDYGYSEKDRLDSEIAVTRVGEDDYLRAALIHYESLRVGDDNAVLPSIISDVFYERRLDGFGGIATLTADAQTLLRYSDVDGDGRDVARFGLGAHWQRNWVTPAGLLIDGQIGADFDYYAISQDVAFDADVMRTVPSAALTLRYPLIRTTARATHVIEPVVQVAWSDVYGGDVPNEDSTETEFDQTNLFALSRFPGQDAREVGARVAYGARWTRVSPDAWNATLTFGRILREQSNTEFTTSSGLQGTSSDWLLAGQVDFPNGLAIDGRTIFDDTLNFAKSEARVSWSDDRLDLAASYLWIDDTTAVSEWTLESAYQINDIWSISADASYDFITNRAARATVGVGWQNECVALDLSVSRRFSSSTTVDPVTDFGLTVELRGFSAGRTAGQATRNCVN
ncbi:LPS-assembly protein LptD [Octadecabacter sp. R77987]|uniref:LPS-assembly protein LptD n=1 Tax=Octadecabacter sp. R77987 TaxID=3093874 RepID=UPI0036702ED0